MTCRFFVLFTIAAFAAAGCGSPDEPTPAPGEVGAPIPGDTAGTGVAPGDGMTPTAGTGGAPGADPTLPDPVDPGPAADPGSMMIDPKTPLTEIPASCRGFEVMGLEFSPGGSVLPNKCAAFDNIFNNPYAIRCIDADPSYDTGWPGDEWCILPPEADKGIQVGVNPASYENPDPGFVLAAGVETTQNYYTNSSNTEALYYYRVNLRMRTGSHHIINSLIPDRADGWTLENDTGLGQKSFLGSQRPDSDRPTEILEVPPENEGLGDLLDANQQFQFNMHHFNFGKEPMLREVWVNIWWKPESEVKEAMGGIAIFAPFEDSFVAPGVHSEMKYRCDVSGNTRILSLNGHRHSHTIRFGVWIDRAGGGTENVYESFDYNDMPTYSYDSISMNPVPDLATKTDGATNGILEVGPGDVINFVCDVDNSMGTQFLKFANEVMTGEMCILFGARTGSPLCGQGTRTN